MRVLVCPDKFKGSLTALEAAQAIAAGWTSIFPDDACTLLPIADGGEGTAEIVCAARNGTWVTVTVQDPLGRPVDARYALVGPADDQTAVIEMSAASGLTLVRAEERRPLDASTFGTGQLMAHAARVSGAKRLIVGIGGSATNDGGAGMAAALGFCFLDAVGREVEPRPRNLGAVVRIEAPAESMPPVTIACDVRNPLLGERGATAIYGPQKGVTAREHDRLEATLTRLADVTQTLLGVDHRHAEGAGAAGGLGFGLLAFCGAEMRPGFDLLADLIGLEAAIGAHDFVLTGEGGMDGQTLEGKGPAGVGLMARRLGKPCAAFAGRIEQANGAEAALAAVFDAVLPIAPGPIRFEESVAQGQELLTAAAARAARWVRLGR